jgi:small-conductance mechanosensitive channel
MPTLLDDLLNSLPQPWHSLAIPVAVFLLITGLGLLVRRIVFTRLREWAKTSVTSFDESLLDALHGPTLLWILILAISVATDSSDLPPKFASFAKHSLQVLWILSFTIVVGRFGQRMLRVYGTRKDGSPHMGTLTEVLINVVVGAIGLLMLLRALGVDITTVLTAFGVGGLAVALALQDTLSNFFAGFYVSIAGQVRVGDFIKLDSGQQGYITDIGWRSTTLREPNNNLVVIPNNKLGQSIVTNYYLPERRIVANVVVSVSYDADTAKAEQALLDVALRVAQRDNALWKDPAPSVQLTAFNAAGVEFTLSCQVATYEDVGRVQHELRKEIITNFRAAHIAIPHPVKAIEIRETAQ